MRGREKKRAQIQALFSEGYRICEIVKILKVDRNTVKLWSGRSSVSSKSRSGRPTVLSPTTKAQINKNLKNKIGGSVRKTVRRLNASKRYQEKKKKICRRTVQNHVKRQPWGRTAYKRPVRPLLTAKNIRDRIRLGNMLKESGYLEDGRRGQEKRSHILFTDETWLEISPKGNRQNQRYYTDEKKTIPKVLVPKFGLKVMVAGGFCAQGVTELHLVDQPTVNAAYYKDKILPIYIQSLKNQRLFPKSRKVTFQQDGATPHTAKTVTAVLNNLPFTVWGKGVWPGNSPDLNPLENLWSILKDSAHKPPYPTTKQELFKRFQNEWRNIPGTVLENLAQSLKTRIKEMLNNSGGHTKY
jgi:transposase